MNILYSPAAVQILYYLRRSEFDRVLCKCPNKSHLRVHMVTVVGDNCVGDLLRSEMSVHGPCNYAQIKVRG